METTVSELNRKINGLKIKDVWTDTAKMVKKPSNFNNFRKEIIGRKIENVKRRGKNILFNLSDGKTLLVHQKMTGHLLVGKWKLIEGKWQSIKRGPLGEKTNSYIHLMLYLTEDRMLALSDLRKFAKILLVDSKDLKNLKDIKNLGPEPLAKDFTFKEFKKALEGRRGKIKQVLMNQEVIVGIGNIYSDEILFEAKIHPFRETQKLKEKELKDIYQATKKILKKAIRAKGTSIDEYRTTSGQEGGYQKIRKVYRREGQKCPVCKTAIERRKIGGRSAHFCPQCQK